MMLFITGADADGQAMVAERERENPTMVGLAAFELDPSMVGRITIDASPPAIPSNSDPHLKIASNYDPDSEIASCSHPDSVRISEIPSNSDPDNPHLDIASNYDPDSVRI